VPLVGRALASVLAGLGSLLLGITLTPWIAAVGAIVIAIASFAIAVALLPIGLWLPLGYPLIFLAVGLLAASIFSPILASKRTRS
jgi:hypothetical protein